MLKIIHFYITCPLQIDIEAHELGDGGLTEWLSSGVLKYVNQLGIELHLTSLHSGPRYYANTHCYVRFNLRFKWMLHIIQEMYKLNFRLISSQPNLFVGPGQDSYYSLIEVVFMKDNIWE